MTAAITTKIKDLLIAGGSPAVPSERDGRCGERRAHDGELPGVDRCGRAGAVSFAVSLRDCRGQPCDRPPPEAFTACSTAAAGDACSFDHEGHTVTGACKAGPDGNGPLACAPDRPPPPPPEAIAACAGAADGDACAFDHASDHLAGTCVAGPDPAAPLACAPAR